MTRPASPLTDHDELTTLALAARSGRPKDVEAFARAAQQDVWRFVAHLTDVESADDLTQETLLRALLGLPRFAARASARAWLRSIARRVVVDRYRHAAARPKVAATADWHELADRRCAAEPGFDEGIALADLLSGVPPVRREAFVLTQLVGLSYDEAAQIAGCPVGTVRSRVARAREGLADLLRAAEHDPVPA